MIVILLTIAISTQASTALPLDAVRLSTIYHQSNAIANKYIASDNEILEEFLPLIREYTSKRSSKNPRELS